MQFFLVRVFDEEAQTVASDMDFDKHLNWTSYFTFDQVESWIDSMVAAHSSVANIRSVGTTSQGRAIRLLTISKKAVNIASLSQVLTLSS